MTTAATLSTTPTLPRALSVGVCVPGELPDAALREVLGESEHALAFWHTSPDAAIEACREGEPDLFLLGVRRPDSHSLECIRDLVEACESTKVILVCERSGEGGVRRALDAGARALVPLSKVESALLPVIEVVRAGQVSVPGSRSKEVGRNVLTTRERQVLGQVVLGMTNAEIAAKLFLAESTVKSHLSSAFPKLGVTSRSEAAALILNPTSGVGPGILTIHTEKASAVR